jgi:hypothetical protein
VSHGTREHIFWLLVSWKVWVIISWARFSAKFLIERAPSCLYLSFGILAGSWPLKPMKRRGSKLRSMGFLTSARNSWSIEYHHAVYWKFGTSAVLKSRLQAQMTIGLKLKTILALRPLQRALICPILIAGTQVLLVKTYFSW